MTMSPAPLPSRARPVPPPLCAPGWSRTATTALLFDTPRLVAGLETLFDRMWEDFRSGDLPVPNLTNLACYEEIGLGLRPRPRGREHPA